MDNSATKPWVVLVGGFLGAGKTTLLLAAAKMLELRGLRSAVILNDQGEALVDTELAALHGIARGEVTGGCFCCRLSNLVEVIDAMRAHAPAVILAEPVGSCTDISATTIHPLLELGHRLAPFTVLVDPGRAEELLRPDADPNLSYLFRKQIQEADLICFTKSDVSPKIPALPQFGPFAVRQISARTGQGVATWLDEVLSGDISAGARIIDIDYDQYARAEAALTWLNAQVILQPEIPVPPLTILGPLLDRLDAEFTAAGVAIVHMKAIVHADSGYVKAAFCTNGQEPTLDGMLDASPGRHHELLLNLRSLGEARQVRAIVEHCLHGMGGKLAGLRITCFHPSPPKPERRLSTQVVP